MIALGFFITMFVVGVIVVGWVAYSDIKAKNKEKQFIAEANKYICVANQFFYYGINGNGDPFKTERYYITVLDIIDDYVKYKEIVYSPNGASKPVCENTYSAHKTTLYRYLKQRNAKQIKI